MAVLNEGIKTFTAGAALEANRRVKITSGSTVGYAGADEAHIGVTEADCASGEMIAVRLANMPGTVKLACSAAVAALVPVYGTANGKIDDAVSGSSGVCVGISLEAGTADGAVIEVLPVPGLQGHRVVTGQHTTAAASDTVVTGLSVVLGAWAQFETDHADATYMVQAKIGDQAGTPAAGSILIKSWKTDGSDPTPVAADAFSKSVNWIAIGY